MICLWNKLRAASPACLVVAVMLLSASCSSTSSDIAGVPANLPDIHLAGSTSTPPHHMASYEYPFDSNGRYVGEWAAEGERRAGRSASATSQDADRWGGSHGGATSRKSGGSKSKSSGSSKSKGGSGSYTVKAGDTVERIARRHGTTTKKLMAANGMTSDFLRIGRVLKIP